MKSPLEDTIWGASYGSVAAVQAAFDRFGPEYHQAILASGAPAGAARALMPHLQPGAQGIDFGCGSGVLGIALRDAGFANRSTASTSPRSCSTWRGIPAATAICSGPICSCRRIVPQPAKPYDFAITMGLMGDYVPYYVALPHIVSSLQTRRRPRLRGRAQKHAESCAGKAGARAGPRPPSPKRLFPFPRAS